MLIQTEVMSRPIILLDRRGYFELSNYINNKRLSIIKPFNSLVKDMQGFANVENSKRIIQLGGLPNEMRDGWSKQIKEFVNKNIKESHIEAIQAASERMTRRIERTRKQGLESPSKAAKHWIDEETAKLIANLTAAQLANVHAIIHHQIIWGVTSPYQLARILRPTVGLTEREAVAVSRFYSSLLEQGVGQEAATAQLNRYANYLHRVRTDRIARTELSNAYNFGQWDSVRLARDSGLIDGVVEKSWIAGGSNPCDICLDNEGDGPIPIDQQFSSGDDTPTAHPSCACSVGYQVRR